MYPYNGDGKTNKPKNGQRELTARYLKQELTTLWAANGTKINHYGSTILKIKHKDSTTIRAKLFVCDSDTTILGLRPCIRLGLVTVNCSITKAHTLKQVQNIDDLTKEYPDRFQGIGKFPGLQKIHLIEDATPVVQPPRKFPVHIREELKKELDKMELIGVIKKVTEPTEWVNAIACSRKKMEIYESVWTPNH